MEVKGIDAVTSVIFDFSTSAPIVVVDKKRIELPLMLREHGTLEK